MHALSQLSGKALLMTPTLGVILFREHLETTFRQLAVARLARWRVMCPLFAARAVALKRNSAPLRCAFTYALSPLLI